MSCKKERKKERRKERARAAKKQKKDRKKNCNFIMKQYTVNMCCRNFKLN